MPDKKPYTPDAELWTNGDEIREDYILTNTRNFDPIMIGRSMESEREFYGQQFDLFRAQVRRDAALREKRRIAGEVRLWASINAELGYTESAETLTRAAGDIDRIPEESPNA